MRRFLTLALSMLLVSSTVASAAPSPPTRFPVRLHGKWGFINRSGSLTIPARFTAARDFYEGLAAVKVRNTWGFIDEEGTFAVYPKFDDVVDFDGGFAGVKVKGAWGFIDRTGEFTIPPRYDSITTFHNGSPPAVDIGYGNWQYINETRTALSDVVTRAPCGFSDGMAPVDNLESKYGLADIHGTWVIQPQFPVAPCFSESLAWVEIEDKWGVIDTAGQFVVTPQFKYATPFTEGVAVVDVGPKEGIIRKDGSWLLLPTHTYMGFMSESRIDYGDIAYGWKRGFLDETGKVVIPIQFLGVKSSRGGLAQVETYDGIGYIDRDGNYVWRPTK
jgi:hypothetical protein